MRSKIFIPISGKLIAVTMAILIVTVFLTMNKSLSIFEKNERRATDERNMQLSSQKAEELNTFLMGSIEKARTLGYFMLEDRKRRAEAVSVNSSEGLVDPRLRDVESAQKSMDALFKLDKELLAVELYEVKAGAPVFIARQVKEEKWKDLGVDSSFLDKVAKVQPLPLMKVVQGQFLIFSTTQSPSALLEKKVSLDKLGLLAIGAPLSTSGSGAVGSLVVTYVPLARLQRLFTSSGARSLFMTDEAGNLIVHSYSEYTDQKPDFRSHPTIEKALQDGSVKKQVKYLHPTANETFLSSFVKSPLGLILVSEVSEKTVLLPIQVVKRQAIYVAGILISLMILVVFGFSTSLTIPIERLVEIAHQVAKGDFEVNAQAQIKAQDEVGTLALAFDEMVLGLRERDKVKTLFSKFHGSSVAEEMLQGEIGMRGSNRDVTVFFSDVRGFTAFSEGHTPEEVVDMLNEYFAIMVRIINKNHGVVDKFIGDAIMAVWGAPKSTGEDNYWCVKACLEMREALAELNGLRKTRGQIPIMIGMGVHSGAAISGTIGSNERMEYTVIGDTVNQTSRIESSTKAFGTDLLISDIVAESLMEKYWIEFAGAAEVKGKSEALRLFKVRGRIVDGQKTEVRTEFSDYHAEKADKVKLVS